MKNRLAKLRKEKRLTLKELGKEVSMRDNTLSQYETGKREPKLETWQKLADYFNVSISYLTGVSNEPNVEKNRLRMVRQSKNMSVNELANAYNKQADECSYLDNVERYIGTEVINSIEQGKYQPSDREWELLSYALDVPEFYLSGRSNDKTGWQEWSEATGYSVEQLKNEVQRLINTNRVNKDDDIQHLIGRAVASLECQTMDTTQGVIHELQAKILNLRNDVSNAFLDPSTTQHSGMSFDERLKRQHPKVRKDMDAKAYNEIYKLLDDVRYRLAKIPISSKYIQKRSNNNHNKNYEEK